MTITKPLQGLACLSKDERSRIAGMGGRACSHRTWQDPAMAAECGQRGGKAVPAESRMFAKDRELAREAARKGGLASAAKRRAARAAAEKP